MPSESPNHSADLPNLPSGGAGVASYRSGNPGQDGEP